MKFGVVMFPGSNCDRDMVDALQNDLQQEVITLWHKDKDISAFTTQDCIVLPGGFSYGDYLRCGAIARFSPMMQSVSSFAEKGGKVLGVCNGFQILCESGLLPGALLRNEQQKFAMIEPNTPRWADHRYLKGSLAKYLGACGSLDDNLLISVFI